MPAIPLTGPIPFNTGPPKKGDPTAAVSPEVDAYDQMLKARLDAVSRTDLAAMEANERFVQFSRAPQSRPVAMQKAVPTGLRKGRGPVSLDEIAARISLIKAAPVSVGAGDNNE